MTSFCHTEHSSSAFYRRVPLTRTVYADHTTPLRLLALLREQYEHVFLLESLADPQHRGRYTFLGYQPTLTVSARNGKVTITHCGDGAQTVTTQENPSQVITRIIEEHRSPRSKDLPPFTGGLVGYLAYDYFAVQESALTLAAQDDEGFNDVDLMLFENVICFDHLNQHIVLITNIDPADGEDGPRGRQAGLRILETMEELVFEQPTQSVPALRLAEPLTPDMTCEDFSQIVTTAKHHIVEGDIFQVVLANRLRARAEGSLYDVYRTLRTTNPSPYMFYFTSPDVEIAGASPETLVSVQNSVVRTFPLAGTRPRGRTPEEDKALEEDVLSDPKELSEHYMLVDLGRNDLGRCAELGSVKVTELAHVHRYSHVMHIGSVVEATLRENATPMDAVGAVLPAGTLSGAPKIRAAQIIDKLEGVRRGIYGGAIGYIDFTGNMDMCIAIRLVYKKNGVVAVRSGAGIVADSIPEREYQETINKAKAVVEAIQRADGGLSRVVSQSTGTPAGTQDHVTQQPKEQVKEETE